MQSMTSENPNKDPQLEGLGMPKRANGKSWLPEPLDAEATEWLKNPRKFGHAKGFRGWVPGKTHESALPPLEHDMFTYLWDVNDRCTVNHENLPPIAYLNPAIPDPGTSAYLPVGPTFKYTNDVPYYWSKGCYIADFDLDLEARADLAGKLKNLECPVNHAPVGAKPYWNSDGKYEFRIPGLTKVEFGVPYAIRHGRSEGNTNGDIPDPRQLETRVVAYSLQRNCGLGAGSVVVKHLCRRLHELLYGKDDQDPHFEYYHRNMRSSSVDPVNKFDGSYSLAVTVEEVGKGKVQAAKQEDEGLIGKLVHRHEVLQILDELGFFFVQRSLMPHELYLWQLQNEVNNATTFGIHRLHTGVQLNHTTGFAPLEVSIGATQGNFHPDIHDLPTTVTVVIMTCLVRKGAKVSCGAFAWAQTGCFTEDTMDPGEDYNDEWELRIFVFVFKGNEPHRGYAPTVSEDMRTQLGEDGCIRDVFVLYTTERAVDRESASTATAPDGGVYAQTPSSAGQPEDSTARTALTHNAVLHPSRAHHISAILYDEIGRVVSTMYRLGALLNAEALRNLFKKVTIIGINGRRYELDLPFARLLLPTEGTEDMLELACRYLQWNYSFCDDTNSKVRRINLTNSSKKRKQSKITGDLSDWNLIMDFISSKMTRRTAEERGAQQVDYPLIVLDDIVDVQWQMDSGSNIVIVQKSEPDGNEVTIQDTNALIATFRKSPDAASTFWQFMVSRASDTQCQQHLGLWTALIESDVSAQGGGKQVSQDGGVEESRRSNRLKKKATTGLIPKPDQPTRMVGAVAWSGEEISEKSVVEMLRFVLDHNKSDTELSRLSDNASLANRSSTFHRTAVAMPFQYPINVKDIDSAAMFDTWNRHQTEQRLHQALSNHSQQSTTSLLGGLDHALEACSAVSGHIFEAGRSEVSMTATLYISLFSLGSIYRWLHFDASQLCEAVSKCICSNGTFNAQSYPNGLDDSRKAQFHALARIAELVAKYRLSKKQQGGIRLESTLFRPWQQFMGKHNSVTLRLQSVGALEPFPLTGTVVQQSAWLKAFQSSICSGLYQAILDIIISPKCEDLFQAMVGHVDKVAVVDLRQGAMVVGALVYYICDTLGSPAILLNRQLWAKIVLNPGHLFPRWHQRGRSQLYPSLYNSIRQDARATFKSLVDSIEDILKELWVTENDELNPCESDDDTNDDVPRETLKCPPSTWFMIQSNSLINAMRKSIASLSGGKQKIQKLQNPCANPRAASSKDPKVCVWWESALTFDVTITGPSITSWFPAVNLKPMLALIFGCDSLMQKLNEADGQLRRILLEDFHSHDVSSGRWLSSSSYDEVMLWILTGSLSGLKSDYDPDRTMAVRSLQRSTSLLRSIMMSSSIVGSDHTRLLTQPNSIGMLIYFCGTAQCWTTQKFARQVGWATEPEQVLQCLEAWAEKPKHSRMAEGNVENTKLYGQPNTYHSFLKSRDNFEMEKPSHMNQVKESVEEWFGEDVRSYWTQFLETHGVLDQVPNNRIPWTNGYQFLCDLKVKFSINGFGGGIMPMQAANTLSLLGLFAPPTKVDMALFIAVSSGDKPLGGQKGLQYLGFPTAGKDKKIVFASFSMLFEYLTQLLPDDVKHRIGFGPMQLEHLLCKLVRLADTIAKVRGKSPEHPRVQAALQQLSNYALRWNREEANLSECSMPNFIASQLLEVDGHYNDFKAILQELNYQNR